MTGLLQVAAEQCEVGGTSAKQQSVNSTYSAYWLLPICHSVFANASNYQYAAGEGSGYERQSCLNFNIISTFRQRRRYTVPLAFY